MKPACARSCPIGLLCGCPYPWVQTTEATTKHIGSRMRAVEKRGRIKRSTSDKAQRQPAVVPARAGLSSVEVSLASVVHVVSIHTDNASYPNDGHLPMKWVAMDARGHQLPRQSPPKMTASPWLRTRLPKQRLSRMLKRDHVRTQ